MGELLIRNVRPLGAATCDVLVRDGRIHSIGPSLAGEAAAVVEEGRGALVLPGLVEAHTHLDKTMWGMPWYKNEVGPRIVDRIDNESLNRRRLGIDPARQSARQCIQSSLMGTTHIRSHVDVDTDHGLWGIEGVMRTREDC